MDELVGIMESFETNEVIIHACNEMHKFKREFKL